MTGSPRHTPDSEAKGGVGRHEGKLGLRSQPIDLEINMQLTLAQRANRIFAPYGSPCSALDGRFMADTGERFRVSVHTTLAQ